jgi:hypothetical protein
MGKESCINLTAALTENAGRFKVSSLEEETCLGSLEYVPNSANGNEDVVRDWGQQGLSKLRAAKAVRTTAGTVGIRTVAPRYAGINSPLTRRSFIQQLSYYGVTESRFPNLKQERQFSGLPRKDFLLVFLFQHTNSLCSTQLPGGT